MRKSDQLTLPQSGWRAACVSLLAALLLLSPANGIAQAGAVNDEPLAIRWSGELEVITGDDFANRRSFTSYKLRKRSRVYRLRLPGRKPALRSGERVSIRGRKLRNRRIIEVAAGGIKRRYGRGGPVVARLGGSRPTVVLRITSSDGSMSCTKEAIAGLMWSNARNVDGMYRAASYQKLNFPGDANRDGLPDVFDVQVNANSAGACDYGGLGSLADQAAASAGVNLALYTHIGYVLPSNVNCSWAGLAYLGGTPGRFYIHGANCSTTDIDVHEMGHNLTMHHAVYNGNEYGDLSCQMGRSGVGMRYFNGPHQRQMDWVPSSEVVAHTGAQREYTLAALEKTPANDGVPMLVTLPKADTNDTYYLSYRRKSADANYSANLGADYDAKLSIHTWKGGGEKSYLIANLGDGQTFTDPVNGWTITQLSHNDANFTARISIGAPCTGRTPTLRVSAQQPSPAGRSTAVNYVVSVTNGDDASCGSGAFSLTAAVPAGWPAAQIVPAALNLAPGASTEAAMTVTAPAAAISGTFPITVTISGSDGNASHTPVSATANYVLDVTPPAVPPAVRLIIVGQ